MKQLLEVKLMEAEQETALSSDLQGTKELANMYENLVNPERIAERKLKAKRRDFVLKRNNKYRL